MKHISKLRPDGNSLVITVPSNWVEYFELNVGDFLEWSLLNIKKKSESEKQ